MSPLEIPLEVRKEMEIARRQVRAVYCARTLQKFCENCVKCGKKSIYPIK